MGKNQTAADQLTPLEAAVKKITDRLDAVAELRRACGSRRYEWSQKVRRQGDEASAQVALCNREDAVFSEEQLDLTDEVNELQKKIEPLREQAIDEARAAADAAIAPLILEYNPLIQKAAKVAIKIQDEIRKVRPFGGAHLWSNNELPELHALYVGYPMPDKMETYFKPDVPQYPEIHRGIYQLAGRLNSGTQQNLKRQGKW